MMVKKMMMTTMMVAGVFVALIGMASCGSKSNNDAAEQIVETTEVEQVQPMPQVHRAAFLPTENTPDFVDAAEASVNAVVHIKTTIVRKTTTYNDFFGALL